MRTHNSDPRKLGKGVRSEGIVGFKLLDASEEGKVEEPIERLT